MTTPPPSLDVVDVARRLTAAQRRAYIDTARRSQPIAELERKARKAKGRHGGLPEGADLSLARNAAWYQQACSAYGVLGNWWPINFCSQCSEFGRGAFDERTGRFERPISHKARCIYGGDLSPYPGWSAVSSLLPSAFALRAHLERTNDDR